ncbi:hypothetical protein PC110_g4157 [Phytophthora cactorum]|uniref:Uncharacterized protein n=1 Tax=Phytophthora cactorum TaxID=29920 RepID=A0A329SUJ9_9STRA|nr:hypothetical protein PC110_g4157 [Phytophthora cactorum]
MLQSLSIQPLVPVMGGDPCNHSRPEPVADVLTSPESRKGINAVVHVYFRSTAAAQSQPLQERTPDYSFRCTFAELKKLRSQIQSTVGPGGHCAHCKRMEPLSSFLNQLMCFAAQLGAEDHPEFAAIMARFMQPRDEV